MSRPPQRTRIGQWPIGGRPLLNATPLLTGVTPTSDTTSGGSALTLEGTNLVSGVVYVGSNKATGVAVSGGTQLLATIPASSSTGTATIQYAVANSVTQQISGVFSYSSVTAPAGVTPTLINAYSFETGSYGPITNWNHGTPTASAPRTISFSTTCASSGGTSIKFYLPATSSDLGGQFSLASFPSDVTVERIYTKFDFYIDAPLDGTFKFHLFFPTANGQLGGWYLAGGNLGFAPIGWPNTGSAEWNSQAYYYKTASSLTNAWHTLYTDYWRLGDLGGSVITTGNGEPSWQVSLDGVALTSGIGNPPQQGAQGNGYWKNGRVYVGWRNSTQGIAWMEWAGVLNGSPANTVATNLWIDNISVSTSPIGS